MQVKESNTTNSDKTRWACLFVLVMLPFMATLDSSIVNVALPTMASDMGVSSGTIAWVVSTYLIFLAAGILFFGRLGDIIGNIRVFQAGLLLFTLGSALCGLADSFGLLIAARAVQALGGAASMANNQGIITRIFPVSERGRALGINAAFVALGTLVGPPLGGLILSFASWEYLFWINVPVGLIVSIAGFKLFPKEERRAGGKVDYKGAALFALGVIALFLALGQGQSMGFGSPFILGCFAVAAAALALFFHAQLHTEAPLLQLDIFRSKWFSVSIFCAFTSFVAISSYSIVMPFYLQNVLGMSAGRAGLFMTVYPLVLALVAPLSGYLSDRIGSEGLTLVGLTLTCLGLVSIISLGTSQDIPRLVLSIALMAVGNGLFQSPNTSIVMSAISPDKLGVGGSVNALVRTLGQSLGTAMATALLFGGMSMSLGRHVTGYLPGENDAFMFGMRLAFVAATGVCLLGVIVTAARLVQRKRPKAS